MLVCYIYGSCMSNLGYNDTDSTNSTHSSTYYTDYTNNIPTN